MDVFFSGTTVQKFLTTSIVREATLTRVPGRDKVLIKRYPVCLYSGRKAGMLFLNREGCSLLEPHWDLQEL